MKSARTTIAVVLACLAGAALSGLALAATPAEEMTVFQAQLHHGQVHAVVFHPKVHKMHVSLNGGKKVVVVYPPSQQQQLVNQIKAQRVSVEVAKKKTTKSSSHHKLRYIAGAIVIVVIIVVIAVLLYDRRRKLRADEEGPAPVAPTGSR